MHSRRRAERGPGGENARHSISSATTTVNPLATDPASSEPRSLTNSLLTTRTAAEAATSARAAQAAAPVYASSAPSITAFWVISEEEFIHTQQLNSVGTGLGEEGYSMNRLESVMNEPCEDRKEHEAKKLRLMDGLFVLSEELD